MKPTEENSPSVTKAHTFVTWSKQDGWNPKLIKGGHEVYFEDSEGNSFIDFSSQLMCSNLGHGNKKVAEAMWKQSQKIEYVAPSFDTEIRREVTAKLRNLVPKELVKYFFGTSGTEANEAAIKISRLVKWGEKKTKVLSFFNSYHGSTLGSLQSTGDFRRPMADFVDNAAGFAHLPPPYCYRCPFGLKYPDCGIACAEYVDYAIEKEGNVAAIILEPVTGTNGVVIPPNEFLPRIREITRERGVILIADEVMSGFGRTGKWFAVEHSGVVPDILTSAKGLTAAYAPLSLTAVNEEISDYFNENYFPHGHTYEAHPVSLAAASATIDEYTERKVLDNVNSLSKVLKVRLEEMKQKHSAIGDVRSIGLFAAIELVKDREKKTPFNNYLEKIKGEKSVVDKVAKSAMESGVFVSTWITHLIIAPPLIINLEELNRGLDVIDQSLSIADGIARS